MSMLRSILGIVFVMVGAIVLPRKGSAATPATVVEARIQAAAGPVQAGSAVKADIVAQIVPGYHINDHHPSLDYLIPTKVSLRPVDEVTVEKINYPAGKLQKLAFADNPISVYEGKLVIQVVLRVRPGAKPGVYIVQGKLAYQACNDRACLAPTSVPLSLRITVIDRKASPRAEAAQPNRYASRG